MLRHDTRPSLRHPRSWWDERLDGQQKLADGYKAICPAHDDDGPSLHVTDKGGAQKPPVIHCFAGCAYTDVERAARTGDEPTAKVVRRSKTDAKADSIVVGSNDPIAWFASYTGVARDFLTTLDIRAQDDRVYFTFPHNGIAKWRVASSEAKSMGWNKTGAFTPYLWPMPGEVMPDTIYLTEGESDCVVLRRLGYEAHAITHGAKASLPDGIYRLLRERGVSHIVLCFDQDDTGEKAIEQYSIDAIEAGLSVSTLRPRLRLLEGETDLRDWYLRTKGEEPLEAENEVGALSLEELASTMPTTIPWLTQGFFAREAVTLVAGPPKSGKSSLVAHFISCHEEGRSFLGVPTHKGQAILMTEEFGGTIIEKAQQFGVTGMKVLTQNQAARQGWTFADALSKMVAQAQRSDDSVLVIDTLSAWAQFKDENDAAEVTRAMTLVRNTAAGSGLCVIVIHHTKKGGGDYGEAVRGSSALFAQADILLEYQYKGKEAREVTVTSRYAFPPDPVMLRLTSDGQLEVIDATELLTEEAQPVLEVLAEGPATRRELEVKLNRSPGNTQLRKHLDNLEFLGKVEVTLGARQVKTYNLVKDGQDGGAIAKLNVRMVTRHKPAQRPAENVV